MHNRPIRVADDAVAPDVVAACEAVVSWELVLARDVVEPLKLADGGLMPEGFGRALTFGG